MIRRDMLTSLDLFLKQMLLANFASNICSGFSYLRSG
jgi:hypothetical protein